MLKVGIIIQARMGATRLPGKVMKNLAGRPDLWWVAQRCKKSQLAGKVIVATSREKEDDVIYNFCQNEKINVFRGSLTNVLERYYECAKKYQLDIIVRVTADCPLIDTIIIDESIKLFLKTKVDYVSNCLNRIFPRGLDCEVFSFLALERAYHEAKTAEEKEHTTSYIVKNCRTLSYTVPKEYHGQYRLTIDEEEDYNLLFQIYEIFSPKNSTKIIDVKEVIKFLNDHPEIARVNKQIEQKKSIG